VTDEDPFCPAWAMVTQGDGFEQVRVFLRCSESPHHLEPHRARTFDGMVEWATQPLGEAT